MPVADHTSHETQPRVHSHLLLLPGLVAALRQFVRLRQNRRVLNELPDHLLHDIGIDRSEIHSITFHRGRDHTRRGRP